MRSTASTRASSGTRWRRSSRASSAPGSTRATSTSATVARDFTRARAVASAIQTAVRGATSLTCSLGVGTSKVVCKIASDRRKPGGHHGRPAGHGGAVSGPAPGSPAPGVGPACRGAAADRRRRHDRRLASLGDAGAPDAAARDASVRCCATARGESTRATSSSSSSRSRCPLRTRSRATLGPRAAARRGAAPRGARLGAAPELGPLRAHGDGEARGTPTSRSHARQPSTTRRSSDTGMRPSRRARTVGPAARRSRRLGLSAGSCRSTVEVTRARGPRSGRARYRPARARSDATVAERSCRVRGGRARRDARGHAHAEAFDLGGREAGLLTALGFAVGFGLS